jgi:bifunctional non-homologous end joining protein LigD
VSRAVEVEVDGRRLKLSNLDKIFYPGPGFTKGQVIDYYTRVAPAVLPHLRDRPLTMKRYPDGVEGEFFYEKQRPKHAPEWVRTFGVPSDKRVIDYVIADDLPTLVWLANLADLELHTFLARAPDMNAPTMVAFDLDPGEPAGLLECARVALLLRDLIGELGLDCFPKTSGSKGIQVYMPLNTDVSYQRTKPFAHAVARMLEQRRPELIVSKMSKQLRRGKVLIDWSQNDEKKTTVCVYSLRARERPTVSTPLRWKEIEQALDAGEQAALRFDAEQVLERVEDHGDLFAPVLERKQRLPALEGG